MEHRPGTAHPAVYVGLLLLTFSHIHLVHAVDLTKQEWDYIRQKGTIVFVSQTRYPPFEFVDSNGQHEGMMLDVVRWLAVEMGFIPVFTNTTFQEAQEQVLNGKADVLTSLFYSEKRNMRFAFTRTLFEVPASIFVQADRTDIKDVNDLAGKTIAMQAGDYAKEFLETKHIQFHVLETKDFAEAADMVIAGKADAVIGDEQIVLYHVFSNRLTDRIKKVGEPLYRGEDCMAASKANAMLIQVLNKGVDKARRTGVLEKINRKWLGTRLGQRESWVSRYLWPLVAVAGGIFLLSVWVWFWNVRLRQAVRKKTEAIRSSEDALRQNEQMLRGILAASPVAIAMAKERTVAWVNDTWVQMFGLLDESDHVGKNCRILFDSDQECERVSDIISRDLEAGKVSETDVSFVRNDGSSFDAVLRSTSFDPSDAHQGVIVACTDISERKRVEKAIKDSEQRFSQIINFLPDPTFVVDIAGRVVAWNRAIEELTGLRATDMIGKGNYEYSLAFYPERRPVLIDLVLKRDEAAEEAYALVREEGDILVSETRHEDLRFNGRHLWKAARPLYDTQGEVVGAIESIRDITELKRTQELLLETERFRAVADLASGVAHNFNNLLQIIIGGTQLVLMKLQMGSTHGTQETLERILQSCRFGAETVRRLQSFAGLKRNGGEANTEIFDLSDVVRQAADMTTTWWKTKPEREGITINLHMSLGNGCYVKGMKSELFEVVINLIKNASEALPEGGDIRVRTFSEQDYVFLHVKDTGVGITEEDLKRLFNPFFSTKMDVGTGLGLATSRQIVNQHGGQIVVESSEGNGSVFRVQLPMVRDMPADSARHVERPFDRELTILLIDDMEPLVEMMTTGLTERKQSVITALSGRAGIEVFKKNRVDLVICDLGMPDMNGWQVTRSLKELCHEMGIPKPPFIVLTGWSVRRQESEKRSECGVDAVVEKPVDVARLLDVICDIFET